MNAFRYRGKDLEILSREAEEIARDIVNLGAKEDLKELSRRMANLAELVAEVCRQSNQQAKEMQK